jgi:N-acyl-D-amino-acid deacylase
MREQLEEALEAGALGLSTGLAYLSANAASKDEVLNLAAPLAAAGAIYATHMRTEGDRILDAMGEAFEIGRSSSVPVVISHLKCAGIANWGRSGEVLAALDAARHSQQTGCDCYPYAATSTILDLRQVDERENHHHLEHLTSRNGRQDIGRHRSGMADHATRSGAPPQTRRRNLPQHL